MPASLHTHSFYSLLEGTSSPEALLRRAKEGDLEALALTDTNNLYGVVPFVELAARHGLRPIVGACLEHQGSRAVALVADDDGYRNLCRVISRVQLAGVTPPPPPPPPRGEGGPEAALPCSPSPRGGGGGGGGAASPSSPSPCCPP